MPSRGRGVPSRGLRHKAVHRCRALPGDDRQRGRLHAGAAALHLRVDQDGSGLQAPAPAHLQPDGRAEACQGRGLPRYRGQDGPQLHDELLPQPAPGHDPERAGRRRLPALPEPLRRSLHHRLRQMRHGSYGARRRSGEIQHWRPCRADEGKAALDPQKPSGESVLHLHRAALYGHHDER